MPGTVRTFVRRLVRDPARTTPPGWRWRRTSSTTSPAGRGTSTGPGVRWPWRGSRTWARRTHVGRGGPAARPDRGRGRRSPWPRGRSGSRPASRAGARPRADTLKLCGRASSEQAGRLQALAGTAGLPPQQQGRGPGRVRAGPGDRGALRRRGDCRRPADVLPRGLLVTGRSSAGGSWSGWAPRRRPASGCTRSSPRRSAPGPSPTRRRRSSRPACDALGALRSRAAGDVARTATHSATLAEIALDEADGATARGVRRGGPGHRPAVPPDGGPRSADHVARAQLTDGNPPGGDARRSGRSRRPRRRSARTARSPSAPASPRPRGRARAGQPTPCGSTPPLQRIGALAERDGRTRRGGPRRRSGDRPRGPGG